MRKPQLLLCVWMPRGGGAGPAEDAPTTALSPAEETSTACASQPRYLQRQTQARLTPFRNRHSLPPPFAPSLSSVAASGRCALCSAVWVLSPWDPEGPRVTLTSWTSRVVSPAPTPQGPAPRGLELGIGAGTSRTLPGSVPPELGWALGNWAGAQAFAPSVQLPRLERVAGFPEGHPPESCW